MSNPDLSAGTINVKRFEDGDFTVAECALAANKVRQSSKVNIKPKEYNKENCSSQLQLLPDNGETKESHGMRLVKQHCKETVPHSHRPKAKRTSADVQLLEVGIERRAYSQADRDGRRANLPWAETQSRLAWSCLCRAMLDAYATAERGRRAQPNAVLRVGHELRDRRTHEPIERGMGGVWPLQAHR
jgi:hypothetical protein